MLLRLCDAFAVFARELHVSEGNQSNHGNRSSIDWKRVRLLATPEGNLNEWKRASATPKSVLLKEDVSAVRAEVNCKKGELHIVQWIAYRAKNHDILVAGRNGNSRRETPFNHKNKQSWFLIFSLCSMHVQRNSVTVTSLTWITVTIGYSDSFLSQKGTLYT